MRVLHVVPRISPQSGGPSVALPGLARALGQYGIDTTMLTTNVQPEGRLDVPLNQPVVRDGVTYLFHHAWWTGGRYGFAPSVLETLRRTIASYELVHIHWLYDFSCVAAARAAVRAGVPFVVQPNGSLDPHLVRKNQLLKRTYLATIGRPLLADAAAVIFTTEQEQTLASYGQRRPEWVVPVGLDEESFAALPARGTFRRQFHLDGPFLLFVGRLSPQKGLDLLLGAFARLAGPRPGLRLVLVGPDPDGFGAGIRRQAAQLGIENRVLFTGLVPHDVKLAAYVDAELFVLPSYAENFGAVVTEALICGLPVVISDQVNIHREMRAAGVATVVECTVDSVAAGVEGALADPGLRGRIAVRGPEVVRAQYTWGAVVPGLAARYDTIVRRPRRRTAALRVLHVVPGISPKFGAPANVTDFMRYLTKYGVDATLLTTNADATGRLDVPLNRPVVHQGVAASFHDVRRIGGRWGLAPSLRQTLRDTVRTYDLVHIHWLYDFSSIAAAREARAAGVPFVVQPRGSLDPHLSRRNRWLKRTYLATVGRPLLTDAAAVIFTAEQERRLASYAPRRPEWVIPVGLDMARFDRLPPRTAFRAAFPQIGGPFLLFLGRLSPQKGLDLLLPAFQRVLAQRPDLWLVIAGPDYRGYEADVRRMIRDLGLEHRVVLTGLLDHEAKLAAFVDAELFVLPSYAENFGVVITEALACGLPVVISDQVNIHPELAAAGAATVVRCDPDSVAGGIREALADQDLRRRTAILGPELVRSRYAWDAIVPVLIRRYREVV